VTDRGEGLDRSIANQAFDQPFSTGEPTLRKERSGAGVGLHLARQIIVEHGGVMWADPLPGGGTRISFCLPIREGQRLAAPPVGVSLASHPWWRRAPPGAFPPLRRTTGCRERSSG